MARFLAISIFASTIVWQQAVHAELVTVYLAAGQSNAKATWANSIQSTLRDLRGDSSVVAHSQHNGDALGQWFTDEPRGNYFDDLAVLNSSFAAVVAAGDTPVFGGLFWFQGESDTGAFATMNMYQQRFNDMLLEYENDLNLSAAVQFAIMVIDADPGFNLPANRTQQKIK